jgi:hypothetical protein
MALAALGLARRADKMRTRSRSVGSAPDAGLAAAASMVMQHKGLALVAAVLAGVVLGGER